MINKIHVTNYLGEALILDLKHPERSGMFVSNISGLGPVKSEINIAESSTSDGGQYSSARMNVRNIVFTLGFLFGPSVEEVRIKSYKYFPIKKKVKLLFETDIRTLEIFGYVESNEPIIFSKQQSTQISILCPDPYFYAQHVNETIFSGVESLFEFPFSNESLSDNLIVISELRLEQEQTVYYDGDSEVGVQIHIHALGPVENITIYNVNTREQMAINHNKIVSLTGSGIKQSDDIIITTYASSKSITLYRSGVYYNILNCLDKDTDWFKISKGDNIFLYTAETGDKNLQFRITNKIAYEGV